MPGLAPSWYSVSLSLPVLSLWPYLPLNAFHSNSHCANMPITRRQIDRQFRNTLCFMPGCRLWQHISATSPCQTACVCVCVCERQTERLKCGNEKEIYSEMYMYFCAFVVFSLFFYHWSFRDASFSQAHFTWLHSHPRTFDLRIFFPEEQI